MDSLADGAKVLLLILAVPVGFGLFILPLALFLKRFGPALHKAAVVEAPEAASPSLWPRPKTREQAHRACRQAAWLPFLFAGVFTLQVALGAAQASALLDAGILVACGFGLRRCSRVAAVLALVLYSATVIISISTVGFFSPLAILYIAGLSYGVYVAFAFHRLPSSTPSERAAA